MSVKTPIGNVLNAIWNNALTLPEIRSSSNLTKKFAKAEAVRSLDDNLGSVWLSTASYVAGQYVIYQSYIYRCIKNTAAGTIPTNATYWEKTNLATEITSLNTNLKSGISKLLPAQSLTAAGGSLTFKDSSITTDSLIVPYATLYGISPSNITTETGSCTVTFDVQSAAFDVCITVRN